MMNEKVSFLGTKMLVTHMLHMNIESNHLICL